MTRLRTLIPDVLRRGGPRLRTLIPDVLRRGGPRLRTPTTTLRGRRVGIDPSDARLAWKLFLTCWAIYALHWSPYVVREHYPALSVVERGTWSADAFLNVSADVFRGPQGGAFINNNPGASLLAIPALFAARPALRAIERWNSAQPMPHVDARLDSVLYLQAVRQRREWYFLAVAFITVATIMAPLGAVAAVSLLLRLRAGGVDSAAAAIVALVYAFGTPVFLRTGYLSHNLLVADATLLGFVILSWPAERVGMRSAVAAGLLAGFAILCDYTGAIVAAAFGLYLLALTRGEDMKRQTALALAYGIPATAGLAALIAYQWAAFGSPLPAQHFMPAVTETSQGYRGLAFPSWSLFVANLFDPRFGMLVYCPLLGLAALAPWVRRGPHVVAAREMWSILLFAGAFLLFCAANQYSWLQWTTGFRYLIPTVAGLTVLALQVVQRWPRAIAFAIVAGTLIQGWLVAVTHSRVSNVFAVVMTDGVEFSWARRMHELGLMQRPALLTIVLMGLTAALFITAWRRELSCAS